ncbi:MAG: hypothetical protein ACLFVR_05650 [Thiohalospira sp.]
MKKIILFLFIIIPIISYSQVENCKLNEIELKGNVQVVEHNADLNVYVSQYEGTNTFLVSLVYHPGHCGEWRIVEFNGDFTIRIVKYEAQADLVIKLKETDLKDEFVKKYIGWELN